MGIRDWFGKSSRVVVELGGSRLEAQGEPEAVERALWPSSST